MLDAHGRQCYLQLGDVNTKFLQPTLLPKSPIPFTKETISPTPWVPPQKKNTTHTHRAGRKHILHQWICFLNPKDGCPYFHFWAKTPAMLGLHQMVHQYGWSFRKASTLNNSQHLETGCPLRQVKLGHNMTYGW